MRINSHNFAHRIPGSGGGMRNSYRRASAEYLIDAVIAIWVDADRPASALALGLRQ
jgi:hypothetical protein